MKAQFKNTGDLLKAFRIGAELSQGDIAEALSKYPNTPVHIQFVSNWERGLCMPPKHCLKNLAAVLKLTRNRKGNLKIALTQDLVLQIDEFYKGLI